MNLDTQSLQPIINFIWTVADDVLINKYLENQYQDVILPMTVLRRLDLALEPTKEKVLKTHNEFKGKIDNLSGLLTSKEHGSGLAFYNTSPYTMKKLLADPKNIDANFLDYLNGFSENVQDIISKFKFRNQLETFENTGITFSLIEKFCSPKVELRPEKISPMAMGYMFEDLIRRFNEKTNAAAGRHFTPREIIELMTHLVYLPVKDKIQQGTYLVYDPCAGSGAMLTQSKRFATNPDGEIKSKATFHLYGQENTGEMYATCKSDMLLKNEDPDKIKFGSTLSEYGFEPDLKFNFMLTNPPYGTNWNEDLQKLSVGADSRSSFMDTRFNLPLRTYAGEVVRTMVKSNIGDGQLMFLVHMLSKMKSPSDGGSRIASVHNGSALFTGDAGSGESNIRQYLIENDLLECVIRLPSDMFYNTGLTTYVLIISNVKEKKRRNKIQLIDSSSDHFYKRMRKSLGDKKVELLPEHISLIQDIYFSYENGENCKIVDNTEFGYHQIVVQRPLLDHNKNPIVSKSGKIKPDPYLKRKEKVPLAVELDNYFENHVIPYENDAWYEKNKIKIGYEIMFNKFFYKFAQPRDLSEISKNFATLAKETTNVGNVVLSELTPTQSPVESNIEWVGSIPKGWPTMQLKYLLNERNERSTDGNEELLSLSKYHGVIPKSELEARSGGAKSLIGYKKVYKGDLVFNKMQAINGLIAKSNLDGICSPDYAVYYPKSDKILVEYLAHILVHTNCKAEFKRVSKGVMEGYIRVYTDALFDLYIPLPSKDEQEKILSLIREKNEVIDFTVSKIKREIELLNEFKNTLIENIVLGKVEHTS
ncbi:N-6 DNA methylase [Cytophaga sp. FL35]|uniref:N-6 DNA methylase n=1 Tax=Cytophaga sp. FL35 TaxID=1904456 RepID=UPI001653D00E|nr:N-6 DNA methylase [Cytophaga sp. FL35]MBC6999663.1 N-6 DNA methylase [Cytophaga sp. FL35]